MALALRSGMGRGGVRPRRQLSADSEKRIPRSARNDKIKLGMTE